MYGVSYGHCLKDDVTTKRAIFWAWLFGLSKVIEFGDTIFVILRKSPLMFLHWYHHLTVLIYTWYGIRRLSEFCLWFAGMNYFVHTLMYTYYAFSASGRKFPAFIAQAITLLQMSQMFFGIIINFLSLKKYEEFDCDVNYGMAYMGLVIYSSYLVLFGNFFFHRYIRRKK